MWHCTVIAPSQEKQLEYSEKCINKNRNLEDKTLLAIIGSSVPMIRTKACPKTTFGILKMQRSFQNALQPEIFQHQNFRIGLRKIYWVDFFFWFCFVKKTFVFLLANVITAVQIIHRLYNTFFSVLQTTACCFPLSNLTSDLRYCFLTLIIDLSGFFVVVVLYCFT